MSDATGKRFWDFALKLYGLNGVKPTLLELQDEHRLNIPFFLFTLWCGNFRRLGEPEMRDYLALAEDYAGQVIEPVRAARRWLKTREPALYAKLLETELACEKALMTRLESAFLEKAAMPSTACGQGAENADLYLRTATAAICNDANARERLDLIYRAYHRLTTEN